MVDFAEFITKINNPGLKERQELARDKFKAEQEEKTAASLIRILDRPDVSPNVKQAIDLKLQSLPQFSGIVDIIRQGRKSQAQQTAERAIPSLFSALASGQIPLEDAQEAIRSADRTLQEDVQRPVRLFDFTKKEPETFAEQKAKATGELTPEEKKRVFFPSLTQEEKELGNIQVIEDPQNPGKFIKAELTVDKDGKIKMQSLGAAPERATKAPSTTITNILDRKAETGAQRQQLDDLLSFSSNLRSLGETLKSPSTEGEIKAILGPAKGRAIKFAETFGVESGTPLGKFLKKTGGLLGVQLTDITPEQTKFLSTTRNLADTILRLRSGAQINEQEQRRMLTFLPHPLLPRNVYESRRSALQDYTNGIISQRQATQLRSGIIPQIDAPADDSHVKLVSHMQTLNLDEFEKVQEAIKRGVSTEEIVGAIEGKLNIDELKGSPANVSETVSNIKNANSRGKATASNVPSVRSQPQSVPDKIALQETSKAVRKQNGLLVQEFLVTHPKSIEAIQSLKDGGQIEADDIGRMLKFIKDNRLSDDQFIQRLERMRGGQ